MSGAKVGVLVYELIHEKVRRLRVKSIKQFRGFCR